MNIEEIASKVHDSWWDEKKTQGFHPPNECTESESLCSKCHNDMYPYDDLPYHVQEYDRVTVRTVLKAMGEL